MDFKDESTIELNNYRNIITDLNKIIYELNEKLNKYELAHNHVKQNFFEQLKEIKVEFSITIKK